MEYTLAEAATATGVNRSTILRAVKSGKLSARRLEDKSYLVEASELARVYELRQPAQAEQETSPLRAQATHKHAQEGAQGIEGGDLSRIELAELRLEVRLLRDQLERERTMMGETVDDLRRRLDAEQEERRALQRQLSPPTPAAPETAQEGQGRVPGAGEAPKVSKGFLARLLGR